MSYIPWVTTGSTQDIPRKVWTPVQFANPLNPDGMSERMPVTEGHSLFTAQLYSTLPALDRPTYIKVRFIRYLDDGTTDPTSYSTLAVPQINLASWHTLQTTFLATDPSFTMGVDVYHDGKVPLTLNTRIFKSWNPLDDVRVSLEGRLNPGA